MVLKPEDRAELIKELKEVFENKNENLLLNQYIELTTKSIEINTKIVGELKVVTEEMKVVSKEITNGIQELLKQNNEKITEMHKDISCKEGYLPKISEKLNYLWVPMISILFGLVLLAAKLFYGAG